MPDELVNLGARRAARDIRSAASTLLRDATIPDGPRRELAKLLNELDVHARLLAPAEADGA